MARGSNCRARSTKLEEGEEEEEKGQEEEEGEMSFHLATVANLNENAKLSFIPDVGSIVWLGLYDDLRIWNWAIGNAYFNNDIDFDNWALDEPYDTRTVESCALMSTQGIWHDTPCSNLHSAVCYDEQDPSTYIFVQTDMTWSQARDYCRSNHTDLASITTTNENNEIASLLSSSAWIGLHRKPWAWADASLSTFNNWDDNEPSSSAKNMLSCAGVNTTTRKWWNADCDEQHYFVCQNVSYFQSSTSTVQQKSKTTYKLKFSSEADLTNPSAQQQILDQLHAKLKNYELPEVKLHWVQTDGQTFQKKEKMTTAQGIQCNETVPAADGELTEREGEEIVSNAISKQLQTCSFPCIFRWIKATSKPVSTPSATL
ncbi:Lithostathine Islet cells regeneration factor [Channa argus]|uniref:Lithostathine Islet cells regeneration factor n=1 Tax=Channa argus TaxID=215402 RepID=A0A6G1QYW3_CHAAH|nr:Lithostathine Islet cells regeneration factor [Channa argus]